MRIRWKLAGVLVAINLTLALTGLVSLGESDPNWAAPTTETQIAKAPQQEFIKLAGILPSFGR